MNFNEYIALVLAGIVQISCVVCGLFIYDLIKGGEKNKTNDRSREI